MKKITREEINKRLEILHKSRLNDESYTITKSSNAMCYSINLEAFDHHSKTFICSSCGKNFERHGSDLRLFSPIEYLERVIERYRLAGMDAEFHNNCPECVSQKGCKGFEVKIKSKEEKEWHVSAPSLYRDTWSYDDYYTSFFEYETVLKFLTVSEKIDDLAKFFDDIYNNKFRKSELEFFVGEELIKNQKVDISEEELKKLGFWHVNYYKEQIVVDNPQLFYSGKPPIDFYKEKGLTINHALDLIKKHTEFGASNKDYIFNRFVSLFSENFQELSYNGIIAEDYNDNVGLIKTQIDLALYKVLELTVVYDVDEIRENLEYVFKVDEEYLPLNPNERDKSYFRELNEYHEYRKLHNRKIWLKKNFIIQHAFKILTETNKQELSIMEYVGFMQKLHETFKEKLEDDSYDLYWNIDNE